MEIDKVALAYLVPRRACLDLCLHLTHKIRSYPRSWASWLKHWLFSKCSFSEKSSHAGFIFYFHSSPAQPSIDLSSHNSHQVFIISSLYTGDQIISQTDSRHEAGGWGAAQTSLSSDIKNCLHCLYFTLLDMTQHNTTQHNTTQHNTTQHNIT